MQRIGPYEVVRELGRGGMGAVFEVRHPELPRRLALKQLLPSSADPDALIRFQREAELLAKVRHPGVLAVHQLGRSPAGVFLVTDLVEGESLQARLRGGPLEPRAAAQLVWALSDALQAVHAQGILHRDLKPENVMVRPDGSPVLLDFGIARELSGERLTQTGSVLGTPSFMAPEQANGMSSSLLDARTDVYGLGAILFAALAGRPPHAGTTLIQTLAQVMSEEPTWPSQEGLPIPANLEAICRRALAKQREARYPDTGALGADLDRFLQGRPVEAAGPPPPRRRGALWAGGLLLAGLGLAAWWGASAGETTGEETPTPTPTRSPRRPEPRATPARDPLTGLLEAGRLPLGGERARAYRELLRWTAAHPDDPRRKTVERVLADLRSRPLAIVPPLDLPARVTKHRIGGGLWIDGREWDLVEVLPRGVRVKPHRGGPVELVEFASMSRLEPMGMIGGARFLDEELLVLYGPARARKVELWELGGADGPRLRHTWKTQPTGRGRGPAVRDVAVWRDAAGRAQGLAAVADTYAVSWLELPPESPDGTPTVSSPPLLGVIPADAQPLPDTTRVFHTLAVSPAGTRVAIGGDWPRVFVFERPGGRLVEAIDWEGQVVYDLAFVDDARLLIAGAGSLGNDGLLQVWNLDQGRDAGLIAAPTRVRCTVAVPGGDRMVLGITRVVGLRDLHDLAAAHPLASPGVTAPLSPIACAHRGHVIGLAFSRQDATRLYTASDSDPGGRSFRVWDLERERLGSTHLRHQPLPSRVHTVDVSPCGSWLVVGDGFGGELWGVGDLPGS